MMRTPARLLLAATFLAPIIASAQGTLSVQGFGYPTGQQSTRSLGAGGALGEIDPMSSSNPASILSFGGSALYFQAEPEYRTLTTGAKSEKTSVARYPLVVASIPVSQNFMIGLSVSNFLDRTFQTTSRGIQQIGDSALATANAFQSQGAIGDMRLALAWAPLTWMHLGVAAHAISGDNRIKNIQVFDDSTRFATLVDSGTLGYIGNAYSTGIEVLAGKNISLAASYRKGGPLSLKRGDTTLANAHVPDRIGFSAAFLGIKGTTIAARTSKDSWSRMQGLGSSNVFITDAWDTSVGADVLGPRLGDRLIQLRAGARWRTLPFGLATSSVSEKSYSFGFGTLLARGRAAFDVAGIRANRTVSTAALSESAWTLSVGITVRP
jgi:hypothetical protein